MIEVNRTFADKEMLTDALTSQKHETGLYNMFANECDCENLRQVVMNILNEEHSIQMELYKEMSKRGWYPVKQAQQEEITQVLNQFEGNN